MRVCRHIHDLGMKNSWTQRSAPSNVRSVNTATAFIVNTVLVTMARILFFLALVVAVVSAFAPAHNGGESIVSIWMVKRSCAHGSLKGCQSSADVCALPYLDAVWFDLASVILPLPWKSLISHTPPFFSMFQSNPRHGLLPRRWSRSRLLMLSAALHRAPTWLHQAPTISVDTSTLLQG